MTDTAADHDVDLAALDALADSFAGQARSPSTVRGYASDMRVFSKWCEQKGLQSLPAEPRTLARYISAHAGVLAAATIARRVCAVSSYHRAGGHPDPATDEYVKEVHAGVRRAYGTRPKQAAPLRLEALRTVLAALPVDGLKAHRDRTALVVGWWGALRRSELAVLRTGDITWTEQGAVVLIRQSKTDQEQRGRVVALPDLGEDPVCPTAALRSWTEVLGTHHGYVFPVMDRHGNAGTGPMSGRAVGRLVKRAAERAGLPEAPRISGHSLRAGFITSASRFASEGEIAAQSGHRSTAVRGYIRGDPFEYNAAATLARTTATTDLSEPT